MKSEAPQTTTICPLCGKAPECPETAVPELFVWSDFCQRHICKQCSLELAMEIYERDGRLFTAAARLSGLDIWECKKQYLIESIAKTKDKLHRESEKIILDFLTASILRCTRQIEAIERYLEEKKKADDPEALAEAEKKLIEALSGREYGIDIVLPGVEKLDFI